MPIASSMNLLEQDDFVAENRGDIFLNDCPHDDTEMVDGICICCECGCEVKKIDFDAEWRRYNDSGNKDSSRCHKQKVSAKNKDVIDKVFQEASLTEIPDNIRQEVWRRYTSIIGENTTRNKKRKSKLAACVMYVCREHELIMTASQLAENFGITRKEMSSGITHYLQNFPESRTLHPRPRDLIERMMKSIGVDKVWLPDILSLADSLHNASATLNHSGPDSVAAAIVYLFLLRNKPVLDNLGVNRATIAKRAGISEITLEKLSTVARETLES
jgi:transcription initiation factor TFIIIB Brf1 subunit/transcription initiation factor TFIIB